MGQRFTHAFQKAFEMGAESVVVIGTDIPHLNRSIIQSAFNALDETDVVIGPAMDGGYYLMGTCQRTATLFLDIDWSSEFVLRQTEQLIRAQDLSIHYLPKLLDVDTEDDYQRWLAGRSSC